MNIVVTGGAGFIGANFVYYMLKKRPADKWWGKIISGDYKDYCHNMCGIDNVLEYSSL